MKIAIRSSGENLTDQLDPRFGRCRYFLIIETDTMSFEVFDNDNAALGGGAGIQSAQFIAAKGTKAVITGHCGPNAMQTLSAAGVQLYVGLAGSVQDFVDKFKNGQLTPTTEANASAHAVGPGVGYRLELHGLRINDNKVRRETKTLPHRSVCSRTIG